MKCKNDIFKERYSDNEIELFERLKMCLMLNELYEKNRDVKFMCSREGCESFISSFQLKQIYIAYIYVVFDQLNIRFSSNEIYKPYIIRIKKILPLSISKKLKDFRDKTFHSQNKSFSNTKELYDFYVDYEKQMTEVTLIYKELFQYFLRNSKKMINSTFDFYESKFYRKIKKED